MKNKYETIWTNIKIYGHTYKTYEITMRNSENIWNTTITNIKQKLLKNNETYGTYNNYNTNMKHKNKIKHLKNEHIWTYKLKKHYVWCCLIRATIYFIWKHIKTKKHMNNYEHTLKYNNQIWKQNNEQHMNNMKNIWLPMKH